MSKKIVLKGCVGKTQDEKDNCAVILDEENQKLRNDFLKDLPLWKDVLITIEVLK